MTTVPQELVELFLLDFDPVEDRDSLKSIALTAPNFAGPAQRVIFRSLAIHGHEMPGWCPSFTRLSKLLDGAPHIASYVKDLAITLPLELSSEHQTLLELVLPRFSSVRRLILKGVGASWDDLQPGLQSVVSACLLRSSLEKLHLVQICDIPLAIIAAAAQTIPILSVQHVSIRKDEESATEDPVPSTKPHLTHLILSSPRGIQSNLFPELISPAYTVNLRHLVIDQSNFTGQFLEAVANTLTSLQLNCTATFEPFALPSLPHVTTLVLQMAPNWESLFPSWLPATLVPLLNAMPALHTLTLRVALPVLDVHGHRQDLALPGTPHTAAALAAVDAVLCGFGAGPRCIWELTIAGAKAKAGKLVPSHIGALRGSQSGSEAVAGTAHGALVFARFRAAVERNAVGLRAGGALDVRFAEQLGYVESLP
ncbi:hypothetical protein DFH06DRAFT_1304398 [Mycena polygramma]|nr:hypothetical protein DFH06DRAFT_1304398 [Mycena polygramma]